MRIERLQARPDGFDIEDASLRSGSVGRDMRDARVQLEADRLGAVVAGLRQGPDEFYLLHARLQERPFPQDGRLARLQDSPLRIEGCGAAVQRGPVAREGTGAGLQVRAFRRYPVSARLQVEAFTRYLRHVAVQAARRFRPGLDARVPLACPEWCSMCQLSLNSRNASS